MTLMRQVCHCHNFCSSSVYPGVSVQRALAPKPGARRGGHLLVAAQSKTEHARILLCYHSANQQPFQAL
jgi:hypothetical protein